MRVLVADDDAVSRRLLQSILTRWGYEPELCEDGLEAWEILQSPNAPKLAILDWMMPGMMGVDICRRLRKVQSFYVYVLLVTTRGERKDMVEALEAGADDYLTKPFDPAELRVRVRVGQRILELQESLLEVQAKLLQQATHDPMTQLWNRAAVLEFLDSEISRTKRSKKPLSLILVDLDHFKRVNDTYGHRVGDLVLCTAAERMRNGLRDYDGIGRYGGEEFLIIMPGCDLESASKRSECIRILLADEEVRSGELRIRLTASFGVAELAGIDPNTADELIRTADKALYRAKALGRNRVESALSQNGGGQAKDEDPP
jgi:two-component system cell cycle response regulator